MSDWNDSTECWSRRREPLRRSRAPIEKELQRYGAEEFASGWDQTRAVIAVKAQGRQIRFELRAHRRIEAQLQPARDRFTALDEEDQTAFRDRGGGSGRSLLDQPAPERQLAHLPPPGAGDTRAAVV